MNWNKLQTLITNNRSFCISSHINPDGDSICSQLSLYWYLSSLGKKVCIYNKDPVPAKFHFLYNADKFSRTRPAGKFDVLIILDASNTERLGWKKVKNTAPVTVVIDHHRDNSYEGDLNFVDYTASATSELLYSFFKAMSVDYPASVAETLYAGILTDTGGFQFSNTNSLVLSISADLSAKGAQCSEIYRRIYSSFSHKALLLRAKIWSSLKFYSSNRISVMELSEDVMKKSGASNGDIEGMSDEALTGADIVVGLFIKYTRSSTHFSLRSKGAVDVGKIAQSIPGGGGHTCAAGCTMNLPVAEARKKMLTLIMKELKKN